MCQYLPVLSHFASKPQHICPLSINTTGEMRDVMKKKYLYASLVYQSILTTCILPQSEKLIVKDSHTQQAY